MAENSAMLIYRLVLTNGLVITCGDPWPDANGKPLELKGSDGKEHRVPGRVYQILFVPDTVESFEDDEGAAAETTPAHYKIFMCAEDGGGLKTDTGDEETQAYTVYASQVLIVGHVYKWLEALQEISDLLGLEAKQEPEQKKQATLQAVP